MGQLAIESAENEHRNVFLRTLLVAYDFSEPAETALRYAIDLSHRFGSMVAVIHVQSAAEFAEEMESGLSTGERRKEIEREMESVRRRLTDQKVENRVFHRTGVSADVLVREAAELHADLVLLGAYGSRRLDPPRLGSTAEAMIRAMSCAVMVIGPEAVLRVRQIPTLRQILYVVPASQKLHSTKFAERFAQRTGAEIEITCAIDQQNEHFDRSSQKLMENQCEALAEQMRNARLSAKWKLLFGPSGHAIANRAKEIQANLILFDHEMHSERSSRRDGAVSDTIQRALCPVLIMPQHD
jgi:nucleotide-binding universal stress UspA family protein